ncbi:LysM peptidoglycan-binding domain-containing protein [Microbacteriaceae bacterium 4G12]
MSAIALVGGLVGLAAPLVAAAASVITTAASSTAEFFTTPEPTEQAIAPEEVAAEEEDVTEEDVPEEDAAAAPTDIPEGYVSVGSGTWIPAGGPGDCAVSAYISLFKPDGGSWTATLSGDLVDMGPHEFATGTAGYAADSRIATYTVESGDSAGAIGDRFCIYNGLALLTVNGYSGGDVIQPGDVLVLDPDAVPGFEWTHAP